MEEFSVSIFWENKKEEVIEVTPGHMRVSMEELGRKQQSCFQIPAGSTTCAREQEADVTGAHHSLLPAGRARAGQQPCVLCL